MIEKINSKEHYISNLGWLESHFHFSFDQYYNPDKMNYGVLRVLNDDIVQPQSGFPTHPHRDMEIISYVVEGKLTHEDSMKNKESLERGSVQYMTAGTGIRHSEWNEDPNNPLRFIQIWILPDEKNITPQYGSKKFSKEERLNKLLKVVSNYNSDNTIHLSQDANIFVCELEKSNSINIEINPDRMIYFLNIEGEVNVNSILLEMRDALKADNESLSITAISDSHFLVVEMAKS